MKKHHLEISPPRLKGVARIFGREALSAICCASEAVQSAADRATAGVRGRKNSQDFHSGRKNEEQADFEVQLENIITITRH